MEFGLSAKQTDAFVAWDKRHKEEAHAGKEPYAGAIGGRLTFSFTRTSIGEVAKVTCGLCCEEHDLTDYSDW